LNSGTATPGTSFAVARAAVATTTADASMRSPVLSVTLDESSCATRVPRRSVSGDSCFASCAGIARHVYQAFLGGGVEGARTFLLRIERELRSVMLLCGARTIEELQRVPRVVTGELVDWLA